MVWSLWLIRMQWSSPVVLMRNTGQYFDTLIAHADACLTRTLYWVLLYGSLGGQAKPSDQSRRTGQAQFASTLNIMLIQASPMPY